MAAGDLVTRGKPGLVIANYNLAYRSPNVNIMLHQ